MAIPEPIVRLPEIPGKKWYESKGRWYSVPDYGGYRPETFAYEQPIPPEKGLGDPALWQRDPIDEADYQRYLQGRQWGPYGSVSNQPAGRDMKYFGATWEQPFYDILKDLTGPAPFLRWYESMFSKLQQRFRGEQGEISAGLPKYLRSYAAGREKAQWAQFLEGYSKEQAYQEYRDITAEDRQYQERRYAPRVRTVQYG